MASESIIVVVLKEGPRGEKGERGATGPAGVNGDGTGISIIGGTGISVEQDGSTFRIINLAPETGNGGSSGGDGGGVQNNFLHIPAPAFAPHSTYPVAEGAFNVGEFDLGLVKKSYLYPSSVTAPAEADDAFCTWVSRLQGFNLQNLRVRLAGGCPTATGIAFCNVRVGVYTDGLRVNLAPLIDVPVNCLVADREYRSNWFDIEPIRVDGGAAQENDLLVIRVGRRPSQTGDTLKAASSSVFHFTYLEISERPTA